MIIIKYYCLKHENIRSCNFLMNFCFFRYENENFCYESAGFANLRYDIENFSFESGIFRYKSEIFIKDLQKLNKQL